MSNAHPRDHKPAADHKPANAPAEQGSPDEVRHEHADPVITEYEKPLPKPGDRDYVAGQPVDDEEASKAEEQTKKTMEENEKRKQEAEAAAEKRQHEATTPKQPEPKSRR